MERTARRPKRLAACGNVAASWLPRAGGAEFLSQKHAKHHLAVLRALYTEAFCAEDSPSQIVITSQLVLFKFFCTEHSRDVLRCLEAATPILTNNK